MKIARILAYRVELPLFETTYQPILSPTRFWRLHQIEFLERCLDKAFEANRRLDH